MSLCLRAPAHAGAREQARELTDALAPDLAGQEVTLDCTDTLVGTPSFLDEVVKQVLEVRGASTLSVHAASPRVQHLLERSAENRQLRDRLLFAVPS
jgi:hypothetical protein